MAFTQAENPTPRALHMSATHKTLMQDQQTEYYLGRSLASVCPSADLHGCLHPETVRALMNIPAPQVTHKREAAEFGFSVAEPFLEQGYPV